ncbi:hypothetical protein G6F70_007057 [Rhizopus microsporus]|nr:hypothetical protein G6F71_007006 [Rhizopus microsporus]KAG1196921.1 hypothetical protein G6F70_007057 [Rhizopus microsporus]KAG1211125.1 hypothetical protein G6F69_004868 [Rhizopus microsporus]KAG1230146.1 hypothetical protein G6F67_006668 [Rhizopus microsporus]KAG1261618.1 hypothetical protein G6F68_006552 [Rhizopus microsporus]
MENTSIVYGAEKKNLYVQCKRLKLWANRKKKSLGLFLCCALKRNIDSRNNKKNYIQQQQQSREDDQVTNDEEEEVISEKIPKSEDNICLLQPVRKEYHGKKCLVLDLDETLVHSSFKTVSRADFIVPIEIEGNKHNVFVLKRPGVDEFMKRMGELYEIVVFTASLSKYADPVLDRFDLHNVIQHRLFREACCDYKEGFVKDLSKLGRDLKHVIILDNTPTSYSLHPSNAIPVSTWFNDQHDSELIDLIPFLEDLAKVEDVAEVLNVSFI